MPGEAFLSEARTRELVAFIKTELSKKVNTSTLLADYQTSDETEAAILSALTSYMTAEEVTTAIATAISKSLSGSYKVVTELPTTGESGVMYLVSVEGGASPDAYDEYIWTNGAFEHIGSTRMDLSQYWAKSDLRAITAEEMKELLA